jgi:hypothetical protein
MRKNKLYTANKYNRLFLTPYANTFDWGGLAAADKKLNPWNYADDKDITQQYKASTNLFGISKADNPFSKGNLQGGLGAMAKTSIGSAVLAGGANIAGGLVYKGLSNGLNSKAGNTVSQAANTVGGLIGQVNPLLGAAISFGGQTLGGGINAFVGTDVNQEKLNAAKEGTLAYNNYTSAASTFDELSSPAAQAAVQDAYRGGLLKKGWAREHNAELKDDRRAAELLAYRNLEANLNNLSRDQYNNALVNFSAYGGPLNAVGLMQQDKYFDVINNRSKALAKVNPIYAGGGALTASFISDFNDDPIKAVINYKQGLANLAAQREAVEIEKEKEAQYAALQDKLLGIEAQNQALQAQLNAMPVTPLDTSIPEVSGGYNENNFESDYEPYIYSSDEKNKNWKYIEKELRKTGKFSDAQIEGIRLNIKRESGYNPDVWGDNGAALGLAQWHSDRQPKDKSLAGQTKHLIDTLLHYDGRKHWIGKDNYEGFMSARTPEEAHYYIAKGYERPANWVMKNLEEEYKKSMKKKAYGGPLFAFGGELGTNGTDWTNGLLYVDAGGSHENNPIGGVPLGVDSEGVPNLVEEGETVFNDYVFSKRMNVPDSIKNSLGLGGYIKKELSFAEASKKLAKESEQRPNDPISRAGLEEGLNRLAQVQEMERMRKQMERDTEAMNYADGGKLANVFATRGQMERAHKPYAYDSDWSGFKYFDPNTGKYDSDYLNFAQNINQNWVDKILAGTYGSMDRYNAKNQGIKLTPQEVAKLATDKKYSDMHKAVAAAYEDYRKQQDADASQGTANTGIQSPAAFTTPPFKLPSVMGEPNNSQGYWGPGVGKSFWEAALETGYTGLPSVDWQGNPTGYTDKAPIYLAEGTQPGDEHVKIPYEFPSVLEQRKKSGEFDKRNYVKGTDKNKYKEYPTWMRYAPAVLSGAMTLSDALGLTNVGDYSGADKLEAAAQRAAFAPNVTYSPIGDYIAPQYMDTDYEQNRLNARSNATARDIRNSSAPRGMKIAGLLGAGLNDQIASANLYRQALDYDRAQDLQAADYNRKTNITNAQMGLEAAIANARYQQVARQLGLTGLAQAIAAREAIDQRMGAARSINLNNFITSLGNIGRENFAFNQINSDQGFNFGLRRNGSSYYEKPQ